MGWFGIDEGDLGGRLKVLDERKMGAVLVRWRPVCGMGLEKRKVMAVAREGWPGDFWGKTWGERL